MRFSAADVTSSLSSGSFPFPLLFPLTGDRSYCVAEVASGTCRLREYGRMASTEELLTALDERLLEAIKGKSTPEGGAKLAEARAWITNPDQPHGGSLST